MHRDGMQVCMERTAASCMRMQRSDQSVTAGLGMGGTEKRSM